MRSVWVNSVKVLSGNFTNFKVRQTDDIKYFSFDEDANITKYAHTYVVWCVVLWYVMISMCWLELWLVLVVWPQSGVLSRINMFTVLPWLQWSVGAGSDNRPGRCCCLPPGWWNILTVLLFQNVPSIESDSLLPPGGWPGPVPGGQRVPACRSRGHPPVPLHWHLLLRGTGIRLLRWCGQWLSGRKRTKSATVVVVIVFQYLLSYELKYSVFNRCSTSVYQYKITQETS